MADQFAEFAVSESHDNCVISRDLNEDPPSRVRIYGDGDPGSRDFVGITFHYPGIWDGFLEDDYQQLLNSIHWLASQAPVPGVWIGKFMSIQHSMDDVEIGPMTESSGSFEVSPTCTNLAEAIPILLRHVQVSTTPPETGKSFKAEPVEGIHDYTIDQLGLTAVDLDMVGLNAIGSPNSLV
jgi:hypothetical protein